MPRAALHLEGNQCAVVPQGLAFIFMGTVAPLVIPVAIVQLLCPVGWSVVRREPSVVREENPVVFLAALVEGPFVIDRGIIAFPFYLSPAFARAMYLITVLRPLDIAGFPGSS